MHLYHFKPPLQIRANFQKSILELVPKDRADNVIFLDKVRQVIMYHIQTFILFTLQLGGLFINC